MTTLGNMGELEAIRRLTAMLGKHPDLRVGTGDDCAVAQLPGTGFDQVFTTDPIVENIHFLPTHAPERIGNKAAGRVLSDIAAMGANPQWMLVNVVAPPELECAVLEGIYMGMNALCNRFGGTIIGGDLARGTCLELHVFGTGLLPAGSARLRSGAKVGDALMVTGPLGGSISGKHLDFIPRVEEGIFLRESGLINGMMDISDGLATDLRHILKQSGVGAVVDADRIPKTGSLEQALYDGEDFELLFTMPKAHVERLMAEWPERFAGKPVCVGAISADAGIFRLRHSDGSFQVLEDRAFEHFSDRNVKD